ncbi:hypothetical protein [Sphingobium ummariense]|uniref:hypothetical protein n=1 Tax=Sphingobium ummariense TaxID=420994 RepID=UPI0012683DBF|nr:hypothetical protein [Sphingobium ummariense]
MDDADWFWLLIEQHNGNGVLQMLTQIELTQLTDYMLEVVDCNAGFEEDEFAVNWNGHRLYVERYISHFRIEVGHEDDVLEIPRH